MFAAAVHRVSVMLKLGTSSDPNQSVDWARGWYRRNDEKTEQTCCLTVSAAKIIPKKS